MMVVCDECNNVYGDITYPNGCPWCELRTGRETPPMRTTCETCGCYHDVLTEGCPNCRPKVPTAKTVAEIKHPPQTLMASGKVASTKGPSFHLIPTIALVKLAERFELGEERKGDKAWNATSKNQECLLDRAWLIERCSHVIHHTMKLRDQLAGNIKEGEESPTDNASAIAWGGVFMICATEALATVKE